MCESKILAVQLFGPLLLQAANIILNICLPKGRFCGPPHEKGLICAHKCSRGGVDHGMVGWVSYAGWGEVVHAGVRCIMVGSFVKLGQTDLVMAHPRFL